MADPVVSSPLTYLFDEPPAPAEIREVASGVHWIRMPLPFALNHINLWLLDDGAGVTIVDSGLGDAGTRELWEQVFAAFLRGRPVNRVIVTHLHPDHAGNAGWLSTRFRCPMYMSQAEYLMAHAWRENAAGYTDEASLELFREHGLDEAKREELRAARGGRYKTMVPEFPVRYFRMMDGDTVKIGGRSWSCIVGHGHAPEHIGLYCAEIGLFASS